MNTYLCSYMFDGAEWSFEIKADSFEEARQRLAQIRYNGRVDGKIEATIKVPISNRLLSWWRS